MRGSSLIGRSDFLLQPWRAGGPAIPATHGREFRRKRLSHVQLGFDLVALQRTSTHRCARSAWKRLPRPAFWQHRGAADDGEGPVAIDHLIDADRLVQTRPELLGGADLPCSSASPEHSNQFPSLDESSPGRATARFRILFSSLFIGAVLPRSSRP